MATPTEAGGRERREAKADRLRRWADKREDLGEAAQDAADQTADMIPLGQGKADDSEKGTRP